MPPNKRPRGRRGRRRAALSDDLYTLKLRVLIHELKAAPPALWFLCFYIFMEYIRPYAMYPVLNFLPWGMLSILGTFGSVFLSQQKPASRLNGMDYQFFIMSLIMLLSGLFAWSPAASYKYWGTFATWFMLYISVICILNTPKKLLIFTLFFLLINLKMSGFGAKSFALRGFTFASWGLTGPPGWFHNSGEFAMQMVIVFSLSICLLLALKPFIQSPRRWWFLMFLFPGTAALSVIGSSSRGGQIPLALIVLALILKGKYFFRKIIVLLLIGAIGIQLIPEKQLERFHTMGEDKTSQLRLEHWANAIATIKKHPFGIGYFNWKYYYSANFDVKKVEEVHNTVLQAFVDLGYQGGILFIVMLITAFIMNRRTYLEMQVFEDKPAIAMAAIARGVNFGLAGAFIAALFMSVLYYPPFWLAFAITSTLRHLAHQRTNPAQSLKKRNRRKSVFTQTNEIDPDFSFTS